MSSSERKQGSSRPKQTRNIRARKRSRASQTSEPQGEVYDDVKYLEKVEEVEESSNSKKANIELECSVCLESCVHPAQLPCSHIFCFLCVKGASLQSRQCPLCRSAIPWGFFRNPKLVHTNSEDSKQPDGGFLWFYQGKQGWWQYDSKTTEQLEARYIKDEKRFDVTIAGALYTVDLDRMIQYPTSRVGRTRQIKRDVATAGKLGIAGIPKL